MMTIYADAYATAINCVVPVLAAMLGSMILGVLIGWYYSPGPLGGTPALRSEMQALRQRASELEEHQRLAGHIMQQRMQQREDEAAKERKLLEEEIMALNAELAAARSSVAAMQRNTGAAVEVRDTSHEHTERISRLERSVARIPSLLKELDELREALRLGDGATPKAPARLPEQVYKVLGSSLGKRIKPDDLELVEGIGPKIKEHLGKHGVRTWADVAAAKPTDLKRILDEAGDRFHLHDPSDWPKQARLMVENRWDELRKYQQRLVTSK